MTAHNGTCFCEQLTLSARKAIRGPLDTIQSEQARLKQLDHIQELLVHSKTVISVSNRLVEKMDAVAECDVMGCMQDPAALDHHAAQVVSASAFLEELFYLLDARDVSGTGTSMAADAEQQELMKDVMHLSIIQPYASQANPMKSALREHIENLLLCGLRNLSPNLLGAALQAAFHLDILSSVVGNLLEDLTNVLVERTSSAFDLIAIGKDLGETQPPIVSFHSVLPPYRARFLSPAANKSSEQLQRWTVAVWHRIRALIVDELAPIHAKVYMMERVLRLKQAHDTDLTFLDVVTRQLTCSPTDLLWTAFCSNFDALCSESIQESEFWKFMFVSSFPKLLHIFYELVSRVAMLTDQSSETRGEIPEPIRIFLKNRSQTYLKSVSERWDEGCQRVQMAMTLGSRNPQHYNADVQRFVQMLLTDLEECGFDRVLSSDIASMGTNLFKTLLSQIPSMTRKDENAFLLTVHQPTSSQTINISVGRTLKQLHAHLSHIESTDFPKIRELASAWRKSVLNVIRTNLLDPLLVSARYNLATVLTRIHRFRFNKAHNMNSDAMGADTSAYMMEFCGRMTFLRTKLLPFYVVPEDELHWASELASFALCTFLLHATLLRLPSDAEKLQLVTDMTTLELSLSQFLSDVSRSTNNRPLSLHDCDASFHAVRSFRTLLFEPLSSWKNPSNIREMWHIPDVILVQHLLSKSTTLPLPSDIRGMSKPAYVDWAISMSQVKTSLLSPRVESTVLQEIHQWLSKHGVILENTADEKDKEVFACLKVWDTFFALHKK